MTGLLPASHRGEASSFHQRLEATAKAPGRRADDVSQMLKYRTRPNRPGLFNTIGHGLPFSPQLAAAVHPNKRPCWTASVAAGSGEEPPTGPLSGHTDNRCSFLPIAAIGTKEGTSAGE